MRFFVQAVKEQLKEFSLKTYHFALFNVLREHISRITGGIIDGCGKLYYQAMVFVLYLKYASVETIFFKFHPENSSSHPLIFHGYKHISQNIM